MNTERGYRYTRGNHKNVKVPGTQQGRIGSDAPLTMVLFLQTIARHQWSRSSLERSYPASKATYNTNRERHSIVFSKCSIRSATLYPASVLDRVTPKRDVKQQQTPVISLLFIAALSNLSMGSQPSARNSQAERSSLPSSSALKASNFRRKERPFTSPPPSDHPVGHL